MLQLIFALTVLCNLIKLIQANTLPTSFWFTNIALSNPKYTKLLRDRIVLHLKDPSSKTITSDAFDYQGLTNDAVLTSFFSEVLRLKASVWSFRLVLEDAIIPACGKEYYFPKGSTLWIPVPLIHRDEDVYKNALQFEPDRFLKVDKETDENGHIHEKSIKKVLFSKNGKQTRMSHLPFGGGKSMVIPRRGLLTVSVLEETLRGQL
jgi:cytochrome P450